MIQKLLRLDESVIKEIEDLSKTQHVSFSALIRKIIKKGLDDMKKENELGDKVEFNFSQIAVKNINVLIKLLKMSLASDGRTKSTDDHGNTVYVDCDIFTTDSLVGFLVLSLSDFNQTPPFSYISFEDTKFVEFFQQIIITGATLYALSSQALIERGREYSFTNGGVEFSPPSVAEMLESQYKDLLGVHYTKVKAIKEHIQYFNSSDKLDI